MAQKKKKEVKLYSKKSVIQIKVSNSKPNTMRAQFFEWECVCGLHIYSSSVVFTSLKENKTCMTNFNSTSGTAPLLLLSITVMNSASGIANILLTSAGNVLFALLR